MAADDDGVQVMAVTFTREDLEVRPGEGPAQYSQRMFELFGETSVAAIDHLMTETGLWDELSAVQRDALYMAALIPLFADTLAMMTNSRASQEVRTAMMVAIMCMYLNDAADAPDRPKVLDILHQKIQAGIRLTPPWGEKH